MHPRARLTVEEIASRLEIGRLAVYAMLEHGLLPGIRLGRRWIITRHAYEQWEQTCGMPADAAIALDAAWLARQLGGDPPAARARCASAIGAAADAKLSPLPAPLPKRIRRVTSRPCMAPSRALRPAPAGGLE